MDYVCPICKEISHDLNAFMSHTDDHVVDIIKEKHPEWVQEDGICHKCLEYFRNEIKGE